MSIYRRKGVDITAADVLAKLKDPSHDPAPTIYTTSDMAKAKTVLDRLLSKAKKCELESIKEVVTKNTDW